MAKKINEMTSDDLMTLPDDIEGIVLDVQGRQKQNAAPVQKPQEEPVAEPTPVVKTEQKPTPTAMPKEGNDEGLRHQPYVGHRHHKRHPSLLHHTEQAGTS